MDDDGTVQLVGGLESLPITEFNGEVMRTERKVDVVEERLVDGVWEDVIVGEKVVELTDEEKEKVVKIAKKITELKSTTAK